MNLKDLANMIFKRKGDEALEQDNGVVKEYPSVIFKDKKLHITIGQWIGVLPDSLKNSGDGMTIYLSLSAKELMQRKKISDNDLDTISREFGKVLSMIGIPSQEICTFDNFNEKDLSFTCVFHSTKQQADMAIRWGHFMDAGPQIIITQGDTKKTFNYYSSNKQPITLDFYERNLGPNRTYSYSGSSYSYRGYLSDGNHSLSVSISYPDIFDDPTKYVDFTILENNVSSITFPLDIERVCSAVAKGLLLPSNKYPSIVIEAKEIVNSKDSKDSKDRVTDQAVFRNGQFEKLVVTKNGITTTIDSFDNWSYKTDTAEISQSTTPNDKKTINYGYKDIPIDELEELDTPDVLLKRAQQQVNEVKSLTKTMFQ